MAKLPKRSTKQLRRLQNYLHDGIGTVQCTVQYTVSQKYSESLRKNRACGGLD